MTTLSRREQNRLDKTQRILNAAISVFSETGYSDASMDLIAAKAGWTKPTLYQYFPSKSALFEAMMAAPKDAMMLAFGMVSGKDMVDHLYDFAWAYANVVMQPEFLSLARLTIGEAHRFPDIGEDYQQSGPDQVLAGLMQFMETQHDSKRLVFDDAELAAEDFWGLILSAPRNRALHVPTYSASRADLSKYINNGIRVFLKAYSTQPEHDLARLEKTIGTSGA